MGKPAASRGARAGGARSGSQRDDPPPGGKAGLTYASIFGWASQQ